MKNLKLILITVSLALSVLIFNSCLDSDDGYSLGNFWIDLVTVVPTNETTYYLRMDDGTTLWPAATNAPYYKPKENQRALVNFTILSDTLGGYGHLVKVNRIDEVLTKEIAENKGAQNDSIYGTDPVEIVGIWAGDNFLNVYFKTWFGGEKKHFLNLIPSEEEGVMFEFRHNAYADPKHYNQAGLVAFNLSSLDVEAEERDTVTLTIKVNTFDGDKIYNVKYAITSAQGGDKAQMANNVFFEGLK